MSLKHELCESGTGVPELDTSVLRARQDPVVVGGKSNAEHEVLQNISITKLRRSGGS